jgi:integrase
MAINAEKKKEVSIMAIYAECPICRRKQSLKNKKCQCGQNLDKAKKSQRVRYWVSYYLPGRKQRREPVGFSLEEAKDAHGKRRGQKREGRFFDMLPEAKLTFKQLTKWYLALDRVKEFASYSITKVYLEKFNTEFGDMVISDIRPEHLESLIVKRLKQGNAPATVDQEIGKVKAMINKGFDNDKVGAKTIKAFRKWKKLIKGNANARTRVLTREEFQKLVDHAVPHLKGILFMAYYTGMRKGEILNLTWDKVDLKNRVISLEAQDTKDKEPRTVPVNDELLKALRNIPRALHDQHVFLFRGKPIEDIREALREACKGAGIEYGRLKKGAFVFHDLRHTFNTNARRAGVHESVIMKITGHSTRQMFDRYNTVDDRDILEASQRIGLFLEMSDQSNDQAAPESTKG